jgi:hypothetical protein
VPRHWRKWRASERWSWGSQTTTGTNTRREGNSGEACRIWIDDEYAFTIAHAGEADPGAGADPFAEKDVMAEEENSAHSVDRKTIDTNKNLRVRTDAEFLADLDADFATAETDADFDQHIRANIEEVRERGLEQAANDIVEKHRARLAQKPAQPERAPLDWRDGHTCWKGVHVVAPIGMRRAEIAGILREIAASIDDEERTIKLVNLIAPT